MFLKQCYFSQTTTIQKSNGDWFTYNL